MVDHNIVSVGGEKTLVLSRQHLGPSSCFLLKTWGHPQYFSFSHNLFPIPQEVLLALPSISRRLLLCTDFTSITLLQAVILALLAWISSIAYTTAACPLPSCSPLSTQRKTDPSEMLVRLCHFSA